MQEHDWQPGTLPPNKAALVADPVHRCRNCNWARFPSLQLGGEVVAWWHWRESEGERMIATEPPCEPVAQGTTQQPR